MAASLLAKTSELVRISIALPSIALIAANIAIDVLKMESEGIKAVKELASKNTQGKNILDNLDPNRQSEENGYDDNESNNLQPD